MDYYFPEYFDLPDDYQEILRWILLGKNLIRLGYRGCAKTALIRKFVCLMVAVKRRSFCRWTSYDKDKADENVTSLSNMLIGYPGSRFIRDYGHLYWREQKKTKRKTKEEKKMTGFYTNNGCIIKSNSLRKSTRGLNIYIGGKTLRPDLDILDDIDDDENVLNPRIVLKNYNKVKGAIFGGGHGQKIILGNVIQEDGVLPRLIEDYKKNPNRKIVRTKIYEGDKIHRPQRFVRTKEEADKLNETIDAIDKRVQSIEALREEQGRDRFGANCLLVPMRNDVPIIEEHRMRRERYVGIKGLYGVYLSIDSAESELDGSDPIGLVVGIKEIGKSKRNIKHAEQLTGRQKDLTNVLKRVLFLVEKFEIDKPIIIENKAGGITLKKYLTITGKLSCVLYNPGKKNKTTRLRLTQPQTEAGDITFDPDLDPDFINDVCKFPNIRHDDRVDAYTALIDKTKSGFIDEQTQTEIPREKSIENTVKNDNKDSDVLKLINKYSNKSKFSGF